MLDIAFAAPALPKGGALGILVAEGAAPSGVWQRADEATGGAIARALQAARFTGAKGRSATILAPGAGLTRVVAVGLGKEAGLTPREVEEAAGSLAQAISGDATAALAADGLSAALAAHAAMGAVLRAYRFDRYRTKEKPEDKPKLTALTVLAADAGAAEAEWAVLRPVAEGVFLARDLVSEPPNVLNPEELARRCEALTRLGLKVDVLGPKEMGRLGFGALLGVSQGSVNEPRMVVMRWDGLSAGEGRSGGDAKGGGKRGKAEKAPKGTKAERKAEAAKTDVSKAEAKGEAGASGATAGTGPICLVGKGVTFDSGGISIKPAGGMEDMKWDMAGAGAVVGAMAAIAGRRARADVVGLVGLVENMPSGSAQRPGDVVTTYSGQTVEIINTDAEGRLVLADVIWYAQEKFRPRCIVDLATLTGAMIIALGHEYAGMFADDDAVAQALLAAGTETGEKLWRMPLGDAYDKMLKSEIADMKHVGGRPGGSISAAQFIKRFTNGVPWAHLDIAGTAWSTKDAPCVPKGATAFGVRLLDRMVAQHEGGEHAAGGADATGGQAGHD